jgi:hypothetical protein
MLRHQFQLLARPNRHCAAGRLRSIHELFEAFLPEKAHEYCVIKYGFLAINMLKRGLNGWQR